MPLCLFLVQYQWPNSSDSIAGSHVTLTQTSPGSAEPRGASVLTVAVRNVPRGSTV